VSAKLTVIFAWVSACQIEGCIDVVYCLSFGSKTRPLLCVGHFHSQQAWELNVKIFLHHPNHKRVLEEDTEIIPVSAIPFPVLIVISRNTTS
jgi:hypothetical protein